MTFDMLIAPLTREQFVERYLGERMLLRQQEPGRFSSLVSWAELNAALESSRFAGERCRIVQNKKTLEASAWLVVPGSASGSYVHARNLERLLRNGATLAVNSVEEWLPLIRSISESCDDLLHVPVGINLYAGWRTDQGFDLHWDDHDTMILQVAGRKRWTVYEPTTLHPCEEQRRKDAPPRPTGEPAWDGVLSDGDLLYMPRGWWHVAVPMDEPTLHLTLSWPHKTGLDLMRAVASKLVRHAEVRADLPHLATPDVQQRYIQRLRGLVAEALTDDVIQRFMRLVDQDVQTRPRLNLPESAMPGSPRVEPDSPLRLTVGRRLYFDAVPGTGQVKFKVGDTDWSCAAALVPAFQLLRATLPTTLREMREKVAPALAPALEAQVLMMVAREALWVDRIGRDGSASGVNDAMDAGDAKDAVGTEGTDDTSAARQELAAPAE